MTMTTRLLFKEGDEVRIKPEWQDEGDHKFKWITTDDESLGRVSIMPLGTGLTFPPVQTVLADMLVPKLAE